MKSICAIPLLLLLCSLNFAVAQQSVGVAFYDVDRLYDTSPSSFYDDSHYTPTGRMQWSEERYLNKVQRIAQVIDSMSLPIVVIYGVESEEVVRDIQRSSTLDYSAKHRTLDYYDGLDFALLYYGDMLHINRIGGAASYSYFEGELLGRSISLHLSRRGSRLNAIDLSSEIVVAWGRFDRSDLKRLDLQDPLRRLERAGRGDSRSESGWYLNSRVGVRLDEGIEMSGAGVYITPSLLSGDRSRPLATFSYDSYLGGYSSHLPQYIILEL